MKTAITCITCKEDRMVEINGMLKSSYEKQSPHCHKCGYNEKSKSTSFKKGDLRITGIHNHLWIGGKVSLNCIVCNNTFNVSFYRKNIAKFCSPQCYAKRLRQSMKGKNHWHWKGGITPTNAKIRNSLEYKLWRIAVFERDNYTCIWCGAKGNKGAYLQADHIKPFAYYPELRFAIDNGRTLCIYCHKTTDTWGGKTRRDY